MFENWSKFIHVWIKNVPFGSTIVLMHSSGNNMQIKQQNKCTNEFILLVTLILVTKTM
jgi:hypothetical protein